MLTPTVPGESILWHGRHKANVHALQRCPRALHDPRSHRRCPGAVLMLQSRCA
jgi:hypothetical protein